MAYPESVYANDAEYFEAVAEAYATELQILYDNGCRNVTIDDPNLACELNSISLSVQSINERTPQTFARKR